MAVRAASAIRFGSKLKELRIHLCQRSPESRGVRQFIENSYVPLKENNPKFPILIRECSGIDPIMWARFEYGQEESVSLIDMNKEQVLSTIEEFANRSS